MTDVQKYERVEKSVILPVMADKYLKKRDGQYGGTASRDGR